MDFKHNKRKRRYQTFQRSSKRVRRGPPSATAAKALAKVNYLARLCKPEIKYADLPLQSKTFNSTGIVEIGPTVAEGISSTDRIGLSIRLIDLFFHANVYRHATPATTFCRVILFVDKQQVADQKTSVGNVLETVHVLSQVARRQKGRFRILVDKKFTLTENNPGFMFDINMRLNLTQRYNADMAADWQKNFVYVLFISSEPTNVPTINYNWRHTFTDA